MNKGRKQEFSASFSGMIGSMKFFFYAFLLFTLFILVYYSLIDKEDVVEHRELQYIESWSVTEPDGKTFTAGREYTGDHRYEGFCTISSFLPGNITDNSCLCFAISESSSVYIDGVLRKEFINGRDVLIPGGHVKRFYVILPLNSSDSGKEIVMKRSSFSKHPEIVPETFVSNYNGVYHELFRRFGISFIIASILLIFSFIIVIIGFCMRLWYHHSIGMFYGALCIFVIAAWLITNSYLYPFVFEHYHVDGVVNYMLCLMIPFGPALYLDYVHNGRYRKIVTIALALSAINAVVWTFLHFTGIYSFHAALIWIDIILGVLVSAAGILLLYDLKQGNFQKYKYTAIGFLGFLFFCFIELIILLAQINIEQDDTAMLIGLTFFLTLVVLQQVDDLRKINAEKQRALDISDAKTKFLANMSHEIRTPINSILGMNEMILRENKDRVIDEYAQTVKSSGRMLSMLVNDILDFSKIEAGKLEITNTEFRLSRVLSDIVAMFIDRAVMKNLKLDTIVEENVPDGLFGDEIRIKQVLVNLISNAIKYTDAGSIGILVGGIYTTDDAFSLKLTVKDTGRGIKNEDIDNLFDAFSRADLNRNRNIEGTGLGLAIVKSILDSMDGEINVESEYGKGSAFTVRIPVKITDRTPVSLDAIDSERIPEKAYKCDYSAPDARVLAVDDNHSNLTIVKLFLKATGIKPDLCSNGEDAIKLCKENKYDLILLDHMMPPPDGIETLNIIRNDADSLNKNTPALVLTANAIAGSRQKYLDAGFNDYLTKPLDASELEKTVKKYLPGSKIISMTCSSGNEPVSNGFEDELHVEEFLPVEDLGDYNSGTAAGSPASGDASGSLRDRLSSIPGFDFDNALMHCGGDESIMKVILLDVAEEGPARVERMHKYLDEKDYPAYCIEAHAIKGLMATVGFDGLCKTARKHEFAARDNNEVFISKDGRAFIDEYADVCARLKALL